MSTFERPYCEDQPYATQPVGADCSGVLIDDGLVGQHVYAGEATRLAYGTEEAKEGRDAFLEKRPRDFSRFPKFP